MNARDVLALFGVPGVGTKTYARLVARFGSPGAVFEASDRDILSIDGVGPKLLASLRGHDRDGFVREQERLMEKCGAALVTRGSAQYPPLLDAFASAPPVLFVRGDPSVLTIPTLAFVGTRHPSQWGISMTGRLVTGASLAGYCTVSGMAAGVDTAAHRAALDTGGRTVAVFGCGVDMIYPAGNRELADEIAGAGCLVSHFPMGTPPAQGNFPARNAVIVGLSLASVVVEAPARSGALITARLALKARRPLFSVPGNADSPASEGANALIADGAVPISRFEDIVRHLNKTPSSRPVETVKPSARSVRTPARPLPGGIAGRILSELTGSALQIETLCERIGEPAPVVLSEITMLEMDGFVRQKPGKYFERA